MPIAKKVLAVSIFLLSLFQGFSQNQELNAEKYNVFREKFRERFILLTPDASIQGSHLPMEAIRINSVNKRSGYWADAVWWQGHYVAMLALEYKLSELNGENNEAVLLELKNAVQTYNRLDLTAESCWGGKDTLNGFFIRDDIDTSMKTLFKVDYIISDYRASCGDTFSLKNAPSQDQLWGTYLGFALAIKLVNDDSLNSEIKNITRRLVSIMQTTSDKGKKNWEIRNPVTGDLIQKSGDIRWMQYAHAEAAYYLTGDNFHYKNSARTVWKDIWDLLQNNLLVNKNGNFSWYGVMACSAVINEYGTGAKNCYDWLVKRSHDIVKKRPDLEQPLIFPHLPLVAAILHGYEGNNPVPASQIEEYLNSAPIEGARNYSIRDSVYRSAPPWHSLSLFCPWHNKDNGEFNMLDYMLLYNAYRLVYRSSLPEFEKFVTKDNEQ